MTKRPSTPIEAYHELAREMGVVFVGGYTGRVDDKANWECGKGHEWTTSLTAMRVAHGKRFNGCPHCAGNSRKNEQDYHDLAASKGWKWLGPFVSRAIHKTWWECDKGHRIQKGFSYVKCGHGCVACAGQLPRSKGDYLALGKERGIRWLGFEMPPDTKSVTSWYCAICENIWKTTFDSIQSGSSCPKCANKKKGQSQRLTKQNYRDLAEGQGISWLGTLPERSNTKTLWGCREGHKWQRSYTHQQRGYLCPQCSKKVNGRHTSIPQRKLAELLDGQINYRLDSHFLDIAINHKGHKIAVEYDGWHWHGGQEERDDIRDKKILGAGWRLLKIKGSNLLPSAAELQQALYRLCNDEDFVEIVLPDWGKGNTAKERFGK
jgi:very-short-patch-repair endonuclease